MYTYKLQEERQKEIMYIPKSSTKSCDLCLPLRKIDKFIRGVKVRTSEDLRWGRCDVKSISLLPNILEKQIAIKGNYITEGTTSNAFIVDKNGAIRTHPKTTHILGGVTRDVVIQIAKKQNIKIIEKPFS